MEILLNFSAILLIGFLLYGFLLSCSLPKIKKHHDNKRGSYYYESNKKRKIK
jgi:hypothetical protein